MRQIFVCSPPEKEARVFVRSSSEKPRPVNALANRVSKSYRARSYVLLHRLLRVFDRCLGEKPCRELPARCEAGLWVLLIGIE